MEEAALVRETTRYIYIRHPERELWCQQRGRWTEDRHRALMFTSNIDAFTFCAAAHVPGVLVAFDHHGTELYQLSARALVQNFSGH